MNTHRIKILYEGVRIRKGELECIGCGKGFGSFLVSVGKFEVSARCPCRDGVFAIQLTEFVKGISDKRRDGPFVSIGRARGYFLSFNAGGNQ